MRYYTPNDDKSRERYEKLSREQRKDLDEYENYKDMQSKSHAEDELDKAMYDYNRINQKRRSK